MEDNFNVKIQIFMFLIKWAAGNYFPSDGKLLKNKHLGFIYLYARKDN